jgi:hypothetical protein
MKKFDTDKYTHGHLAFAFEASYLTEYKRGRRTPQLPSLRSTGADAKGKPALASSIKEKVEKLPYTRKSSPVAEFDLANDTAHGLIGLTASRTFARLFGFWNVTGSSPPAKRSGNVWTAVQWGLFQAPTSRLSTWTITLERYIPVRQRKEVGVYVAGFKIKKVLQAMLHVDDFIFGSEVW